MGKDKALELNEDNVSREANDKLIERMAELNDNFVVGNGLLPVVDSPDPKSSTSQSASTKHGENNSELDKKFMERRTNDKN